MDTPNLKTKSVTCSIVKYKTKYFRVQQCQWNSWQDEGWFFSKSSQFYCHIKKNVIFLGQTKEYKKSQGTQPWIYEKMLELAKMAQLWRVVTQSCAIFGSRSTTRIYEMGSHIYDMAYKSNRISSCNLFVYFAQKNYFFYFIHQFLQNTYISLSILHIYSIKYSFFYNFLYFLTHYPSLWQTQHYQKILKY